MRILVVDDHPLARKGVISILSKDYDLDKVKEADSIEKAIEIIKNEKPEIALVDLRLGQQNGLELISKAKEIGCDTKFIILTSFLPREVFLKAEQLGVNGYILKDAFIEDISYAINVICRGRKYFDPSIYDYQNKTNNNENIAGLLTEREREVLNEMGKGATNDEIARTLFISENTVKKHVSSILAKLNLVNRAQVVCFLNSEMSKVY